MLSLVEPSLLLPFFPDTFSCDTFLIGVLTRAMLLASEPLTVIDASISPFINAMTVFLIIHVGAFVASPVGPLHHALSIHLVLDPLAAIGAPVFPCIGAKTMDLVRRELSVVRVSIGPGRFAGSLFDPIDIIAVEFRLIGHRGDTSTLLLILLPKAAMSCTVIMSVDTETMGFLILPESLVIVAIRVDQSAVSVHGVMQQITFV